MLCMWLPPCPGLALSITLLGSETLWRWLLNKSLHMLLMLRFQYIQPGAPQSETFPSLLWSSPTAGWLPCAQFLYTLLRLGEGNGNPLQCSCLENPRDGGAWWAAVYGVAQSRTRLKWLSSSSRFLHSALHCPTLDSSLSCSNILDSWASSTVSLARSVLWHPALGDFPAWKSVRGLQLLHSGLPSLNRRLLPHLGSETTHWVVPPTHTHTHTHTHTGNCLTWLILWCLVLGHCPSMWTSPSPFLVQYSMPGCPSLHRGKFLTLLGLWYPAFNYYRSSPPEHCLLGLV